jgi:hypothetical protein
MELNDFDYETVIKALIKYLPQGSRHGQDLTNHFVKLRNELKAKKEADRGAPNN